MLNLGYVWSFKNTYKIQGFVTNLEKVFFFKIFLFCCYYFGGGGMGGLVGLVQNGITSLGNKVEIRTKIEIGCMH